MMDDAAPLHFGVKKEKVGALTILTPSLRQASTAKLRRFGPISDLRA